MAYPHPAVRALERGLPLSTLARAISAGGDVDHLPIHADARTAAGREALIRWLRSWGCRHLRVEDSAATSRALRSWAARWVDELSARSLTRLTPRDVERGSRAYAALAEKRAALAARPTGLVGVTFGPTAASKALYALRPAGFPPWDAPMRRALAFGDGAEGYARYLELCANGIRASARRAGIEPDELPGALGRPNTTAARLVDEYLWQMLTRGGRPRG
jgi:hypothetical protein